MQIQKAKLSKEDIQKVLSPRTKRISFREIDEKTSILRKLEESIHLELSYNSNIESEFDIEIHKPINIVIRLLWLDENKEGYNIEISNYLEVVGWVDETLTIKIK